MYILHEAIHVVRAQEYSKSRPILPVRMFTFYTPAYPFTQKNDLRLTALLTFLAPQTASEKETKLRKCVRVCYSGSISAASKAENDNDLRLK